MNKLFTKSCVILTLCFYIAVSQFIFKAVATTHIDPVDLEIDSVCYWKKIDTFDSKKNCRQESFTTQAWTETISLEHTVLTSPLLAWSEYVLSTLSTKELRECIQIIRPPPDSKISWVDKYSYIWVVKSLI